MTTQQELQLCAKLHEFTGAYLSNLKSHEKLSEKRFAMLDNRNASRTKKNRIRDDIQCTGENIMRIRHEIHCLAVELSLAAKETERYGDVLVGCAIGELYGSIKQHRREPNI